MMPSKRAFFAIALGTILGVGIPSFTWDHSLHWIGGWLIEGAVSLVGSSAAYFHARRTWKPVDPGTSDSIAGVAIESLGFELTHPARLQSTAAAFLFGSIFVGVVRLRAHREASHSGGSSLT